MLTTTRYRYGPVAVTQVWRHDMAQASAPGIVLTATAISFANEWWDTGTPNFRIPIAGGLLALLLDGVESANEGAGRGLAIIMFITVMLTPFKGKSPLETLAGLAVAQPRTKTVSATNPNLLSPQQVRARQVLHGEAS
jgi:hypothetical protein